MRINEVRINKVLAGSIALLLASCSTTPTSKNSPASVVTDNSNATERAVLDESSRVTAVEATPSGDGYSLAVTVESDETGCDRYANWWEVITPEGELLYRRILAHSHVDEQPFTRSGGPVSIGEEEVVVVRSHVDPEGYSTQAMKGSAREGFVPTTLSDDFAVALSTSEPQPGDCAF